MLVVKTESIKISKDVVLKPESKEIVTLFQCHAYIQEKTKGDITQCLCLKVFDNYKNRPLEDILEEGMYEYYSTNPYAEKMIEILEELVDIARPVLFDTEDILANIN